MLNNKRQKNQKVFSNVSFIRNRKAQVGTTITWVVATLIIVVVLGISVLATFSVSNKKIIFLDDKGKDIIATKSITSFLKENAGLLENNDYNAFEGKLKILMEDFPDITVDYFALYDKDEKKIEIVTPRLSPVTSQFETNILFGQTELKFWSICREKCR
jgi:hypothetical protein